MASTFYFALSSLYEQLETHCDVHFDSLKAPEKAPDSLEYENISLYDLDSLEEFSVSRDTPSDSLNTEDSTFDSLECKSLNHVKSFNNDTNDTSLSQEKNRQLVAPGETEYAPTNVFEFLMFFGKIHKSLANIGIVLSLCRKLRPHSGEDYWLFGWFEP